MTVKAQILTGLRQGPSTLPELMPYEEPTHRAIVAAQLRKAGRIELVGTKVVNSRIANVWRLRPVHAF